MYEIWNFFFNICCYGITQNKYVKFRTRLLWIGTCKKKGSGNKRLFNLIKLSASEFLMRKHEIESK